MGWRAPGQYTSPLRYSSAVCNRLRDRRRASTCQSQPMSRKDLGGPDPRFSPSAQPPPNSLRSAMPRRVFRRFLFCYARPAPGAKYGSRHAKSSFEFGSPQIGRRARKTDLRTTRHQPWSSPNALRRKARPERYKQGETPCNNTTPPEKYRPCLCVAAVAALHSARKRTAL